MIIGNYILVNGTEYWLRGQELLNLFWETLHEKPLLGSFSSSPFDKGYYAKWQLINGKLYLLDFHGTDIFCKRNYTYEEYFGKKGDPIFAEWFTGLIEIQEGEVIFRDHHFGETKRYTYEMNFSKGFLIDTKMRDT